MVSREELLARGRALREKVLGSPKPGAPKTAAAEICPDLVTYSEEVLFGQIWSRPGLELQQRSMITIAMLAAMGGRRAQVAAHIKGGLNVGLTRDQIVEIMFHLAPYACQPLANNGLTVARNVFNELDKQ